MTYEDIKRIAETALNQKIIDYRPASGLFVDGMDDHEQIPNAIVAWLENGDKIIYIAKERSDDYTMGEYWRDVKPELKKKHDERVAKTPDRIEYAIQQFEKHEIQYELKNGATGHFHCWRKSDGQLYQFWASTGKILGYHNRGINLLIKELCK